MTTQTKTKYQTIGNNKPLIAAQKALKAEIGALMKGAARQIGGVALALAGSDGKIPADRERDLLTQAGQIVSDVFTGTDNRSAFASDGVTPISPFAKVLVKWIGAVVYAAVLPHEQWMAKHVPADILEVMKRGTKPVVREYYAGKLRIVSEAQRVKLTPQDVFKPNPLAQIDPTRQWVPPERWNDPNGYRLSDRIWRTDLYTRQQIDKLLMDAVRQGWGAQDIAALAEGYLWPWEADKRTLKPYGEKYMGENGAAYSAMRLGRTELTRAFNSAGYTAALMNPYVNGIDIARSGSGDATCKVCPTHATISIGGQRVRQPYPKEAVNVGPYHPHCLCHERAVVTNTPEQVTADIRQFLQNSQAELNISPADARLFTKQLLPGWGEAWFDRPSDAAPLQMNVPRFNARIWTPDGYAPRDTGKPGATLDSIAAFIQKSDGVLARALKAMMSMDAGFPSLYEDWDTGALGVDGANLKAAAKAFVAEARNFQFSGSYTRGLIQSLAQSNGITLTNQQAQGLYNQTYQAQAEAILTVAKAGGVKLTEPQMRWLGEAADGNYWTMVSAPEKAKARREELKITGGNSGYATEAARDEARRVFLGYIGNIKD